MIRNLNLESEYVAASEAAQEAVWMRKFIEDLGVVPSIRDPIEIFCDNLGAIAQAKEPRLYQKTKHIHRRLLLFEIETALGDKNEQLTDTLKRQYQISRESEKDKNGAISRESTIDKNGAVSQILKRQYRIIRESSTWQEWSRESRQKRDKLVIMIQPVRLQIRMRNPRRYVHNPDKGKDKVCDSRSGLIDAVSSSPAYNELAAKRSCLKCKSHPKQWRRQSSRVIPVKMA
ncbi:hypothetical protein L2E82_37518 [Cichorium intybus]|uniref:Uncharacterized protein n=1 Tax=Cichorium intybus TaxID=13427 RepID=A0ACB9AEH2_CICIN|nr:hypothetical protein L2E82_37518 [Cichorium intybus]